MNIKELLVEGNKFKAIWHEDTAARWWRVQVGEVLEHKVMLHFPDDAEDPYDSYLIDKLKAALDEGVLEIKGYED